MAIISFRYNLIFVKTSKTAGTSIEVDLGQRVEDDAIVTPILPPSSRHVPRNFESEGGRFYNHMTAIEIREILGPEQFSGMFKFCVEREPVSKCISHFHMLRNSPLHVTPQTVDLSWDAYCEQGRFPVDHRKYSEVVDGTRRVIVDRILNYDRLQQDLPGVLATLGIDGFRLIAREKSEYARRSFISPDRVTQSQRAAIYGAFSETLRLAGGALGLTGIAGDGA